jgi:hypothetical protein
VDAGKELSSFEFRCFRLYFQFVLNFSILFEFFTIVLSIPTPRHLKFLVSDAALARWLRIESAAAAACYTSSSLQQDSTCKLIQAKFVQWLNLQSPAKAYATVIWPKKRGPWIISSRHLMSNVIDRL